MSDEEFSEVGGNSSLEYLDIMTESRKMNVERLAKRKN